MSDVKRYPGARIFTALFFVWLYAPILVVIAYSFNENRLASVWTGFSWRWYDSALQNRALLDAVKISLTVASIATVIATTVALMAQDAPDTFRGDALADLEARDATYQHVLSIL